MAAPRIIGICAPGEHFSLQYVGALFDLWVDARAAGYGVGLFQSYSTYCHITRQNIARSVLSSEPAIDYLLWIDDDNLVTWPQVERLIALLEAHPDAGIAAGWYMLRGPGGAVCSSVGVLLEGQGSALLPAAEVGARGEPFLADATGFGCVLMRRECLEHVGPESFFLMPNQEASYGFMGEDFAFCLTMRERGWALWIDPGVAVPHLKLQALIPSPVAAAAPA